MNFTRLELQMQGAGSGAAGSHVARRNSYGSGRNPRQQRAALGKLLSRAVPPLLVCALGLFFRAPVQAQEKVPLVTGPLSSQDKAGKLQIEIVSIGRFAVPSSIHRPPGKFILVIVNKDNASQDSFLLQPAPAGSASQPGNPLMRLGGSAARHGYSGGLFNAPPGTYQITSEKSGSVLCQITIG